MELEQITKSLLVAAMAQVFWFGVRGGENCANIDLYPRFASAQTETKRSWSFWSVITDYSILNKRNTEITDKTEFQKTQNLSLKLSSFAKACDYRHPEFWSRDLVRFWKGILFEANYIQLTKNHKPSNRNTNRTKNY